MRVSQEEGNQLGMGSSSHADESALRLHRSDSIPPDTGPRRPNLLRATTDVGPRSSSPAVPRAQQLQKDDNPWEFRHGWEEQYNSEEYLNALNSAFYMYFTDKRHETGGKPKAGFELEDGPGSWRVQSRVKTVYAGLLLCLNIGVSPPDTIRTNPCAKLEAWTDPESPSSPNSKVMETIGKALQSQYEQLSMRIRYKQVQDPQIDEVKKTCVNLRRNAKEERVLLHYNGHGVPLPTPSGEIWFFNKNYTQYIPISVYDLQGWLGGPSIYVFEAGHAGNVIANFGKFVEKHETENREKLAADPNTAVQFFGENIILCACSPTENLPTNPELPADMFTACLTTPVQISLRCFLIQSDLRGMISLQDLDKIPGSLQNRRSPLGELNWIFTAITDTIAWNTLPKGLFKRLFRQDLMVAALFRNYLLADRLMRQHGCCPQTEPALPRTHDHPLWQSWDLALEMVLVQLPDLLAYEENGIAYEYQHSSFFAEQLSAFDLYLSQGALEKKPPDQLPIVLQVLLSQVHRLRALILLGRFLDLGPWAVKLALNIGIFPYVLKLLQSAAIELKPVLIFIWARILAVDNSCQNDLIRDNGYKYFLATIQPEQGIPVQNLSEHKAMAAFIITMFCKDHSQGKVVSMTRELFQACIGHLGDRENPLLRQWCCLCIGTLWKDFQEAKWTGTRDQTHQVLCHMVLDPVPEVRTAAISALTTFLDYSDHLEQVAITEQSIAAALLMMTQDGNSMVRNELLVFLSTFIKRYENRFLVVAYEELVSQRQRLQEPTFQDVEVKRGRNGAVVSSSASSSSNESPSKFSVYATIWKHLMVLTLDPHIDVARKAITVVDYVHARLMVSPLKDHVRAIFDDLVDIGHKSTQSRAPSPAPIQRLADLPVTPDARKEREDGYFSTGIVKRTTSALWGSLTFRNTSSADVTPSKVIGKHADGHIRGIAPDDWSRPPDAHDSATHSMPYEKARVPLPRGHDPTDAVDVSNAVYNNDGTDLLPLKSTFLDWSTEYFREPQMKTSEPDEPGSDDYNSRLWRRARNEKIINLTQPQKNVAGASKWDLPGGSFMNVSQPRQLCFHQFEEHLAVADDKDTISIWNWQRKRQIGRFSHANPDGSRISELRFINEDDQALLLAGSSDGAIKYYRDYDDMNRISIVSAFRGLSDLVPSNKNVGLVLDWQQSQGKLLVSGDVKMIRVWNAATEICTSEIPSRSSSGITALTSDQVAGNIFVAGFGNGKVQVFDQRERPQTAMVQRYSSHNQWIVNVHMQRGGMRELISGSRNGEIKLWDIRMKDELKTIKATRHTLRALSVHEHAPVFATGSESHHVNFFNVNGTFLNSIEPSSSLLQTRNPIVATAFHPHRMMLACASLHDHHVNIFSCRDKETVVQEI